MSETEEFVRALRRYVEVELATCGEAPDYNTEAVEVVDARNRLFRNVGARRTDESENIYALRDLCYVDDAMNIVPCEARLRSVARNFFG